MPNQASTNSVKVITNGDGHAKDSMEVEDEWIGIGV